MSFITLARELGSISEKEVVRLSELLGMECIGKEFVEKRFDEIGMPHDSLREYDEKKPGFFARIFRGESDHIISDIQRDGSHGEAWLRRHFLSCHGCELHRGLFIVQHSCATRKMHMEIRNRPFVLRFGNYRA